jgi:hypothetical protein
VAEPVYSTFFFASSDLSQGQAQFLVPEGFTAVLRCVDFTVYTVGGWVSQVYVAIFGPDNAPIYLAELGQQSGPLWSQWQGRQVAGEGSGFAATADGVATVYASGYLLTNP